jgi:hypothetical protein
MVSQSVSLYYCELPPVLKKVAAWTCEWRGCPQAVSRESHRTRNKNKQTNKHGVEGVYNLKQTNLNLNSLFQRQTNKQMCIYTLALK